MKKAKHFFFIILAVLTGFYFSGCENSRDRDSVMDMVDAQLKELENDQPDSEKEFPEPEVTLFDVAVNFKSKVDSIRKGILTQNKTIPENLSQTLKVDQFPPTCEHYIDNFSVASNNKDTLAKRLRHMEADVLRCILGEISPKR